jgi:hypothetical protein
MNNCLGHSRRRVDNTIFTNPGYKDHDLSTHLSIDFIHKLLGQHAQRLVRLPEAIIFVI